VTAVPFLDIPAVNDLLRREFDLAWKSVLEHGRFVGGPEVDRFETQFATYCDVRACVGVGNGTDALELILGGLGVGIGDEVIVAAYHHWGPSAVNRLRGMFAFLSWDSESCLLVGLHDLGAWGARPVLAGPEVPRARFRLPGEYRRRADRFDQRCTVLRQPVLQLCEVVCRVEDGQVPPEFVLERRRLKSLDLQDMNLLTGAELEPRRVNGRVGRRRDLGPTHCLR